MLGSGHLRHSCKPDVSGSPQERTLAVGDARGLMGEILQWLWSAPGCARLWAATRIERTIQHRAECCSSIAGALEFGDGFFGQLAECLFVCSRISGLGSAPAR